MRTFYLKINYYILLRIWEHMNYEDMELEHGSLDDALMMEPELLAALVSGAISASGYPSFDYALAVIAPELEKATGGISQAYFNGSLVFCIPGIDTAMWLQYFETNNPFSDVRIKVTEALGEFLDLLPRSGTVLDKAYIYLAGGIGSAIGVDIPTAFSEYQQP